MCMCVNVCVSFTEITIYDGKHGTLISIYSSVINGLKLQQSPPKGRRLHFSEQQQSF